MHSLLDAYLCKRFPKLLAQRYLPMTETCMCWGFDCGDGWFHLLLTTCIALQGHIDAREREITDYERYVAEGEKLDYPKPTPVPQVVFHQVKEKFARLEIYHHGGDATTTAIIDFASLMSCSICDVCGTTKEVGISPNGWNVTTCQTHARSLDNFTRNDDEELLAIWETIKAEKATPKTTT